jgi:hypothetical protein
MRRSGANTLRLDTIPFFFLTYYAIGLAPGDWFESTTVSVLKRL